MNTGLLGKEDVTPNQPKMRCYHAETYQKINVKRL